MSSEQLRHENRKLKQLQESCSDELEKLKDVGRAHENEIDTLLKFNERLLGIIQNEFNAATKNRISSDLQIISETNEGANDFASTKLKTKLSNPPNIEFNHLTEEDLQLFEDEEEEEIYNQEMHAGDISPIGYQPNNFNQPAKLTKLDKVYEMQHHKDEEVSINLTNSVKTNNNPTSSVYNQKESFKKDSSLEPSLELQQLKEMVKQYKQQFVDNSAQYEKICQIIHNDLLSDMQEFKRIEQQSTAFFNEKMQEITNLRNEIKRFKPVHELIRVMRKLNVPKQTENLLNQKIISRQL